MSYNRLNKPKRTELPAINVQGLLHMSHYQAIECTYDEVHNHEEDYDNDYCRCGRIVNVQVKEVHLDYILKEIIDKKRVSEIDQYCTDRILRILEVWNPTNWEVEIDPGYYGEELGDAQLKTEVYDEVTKVITALQNLTTVTEKLFYVLELEYGYILEKLKQDRFKLIEVSRDAIILPQELYAKKLKKSNLNFYKDYDGPVGVCTIENDDKLRLVDGYHRFSASNKKKVQVFVPEWFKYEN